MQRHRRSYKEVVSDTLTRWVIIRRPKKFKSLYNKKMFWAWNYKWDRAYEAKYNTFKYYKRKIGS